MELGMADVDLGCLGNPEFIAQCKMFLGVTPPVQPKPIRLCEQTIIMPSTGKEFSPYATNKMASAAYHLAATILEDCISLVDCQLCAAVVLDNWHRYWETNGEFNENCGRRKTDRPKL